MGVFSICDLDNGSRAPRFRLFCGRTTVDLQVWAIFVLIINRITYQSQLSIGVVIVLNIAHTYLSKYYGYAFAACIEHTKLEHLKFHRDSTQICAAMDLCVAADFCGQSKLEPVKPVKPKLKEPEPVKPEPVTPEPVEPVKPEPVTPAHIEPEPKPVEPEPKPVKPEPVTPAHIEPEHKPVEPEPKPVDLNSLELVTLEPMKPEPVTTKPIEPEPKPIEPEPKRPVKLEPEPRNLNHVQLELKPKASQLNSGEETEIIFQGTSGLDLDQPSEVR